MLNSQLLTNPLNLLNPKNNSTIFSCIKNKVFCSIKDYIKSKLLSGTVGYLEYTDIDGTKYEIGNKDSELKTSIKILNPKFYTRLFWWGPNGFAESYLRNEWQCNELYSTISYFILNFQDKALLDNYKNKDKLLINILKPLNKLIHFTKVNSISGARKNIAYHYDLGNDFFKTFLDQTLTYSSGIYHTNNDRLNTAQINKYKAIIQKLNIKPDHSVLEIGSGWGGFSMYLAKNYGCNITTTTISKEQYQYVKEAIKQNKLESKIKIMLEDYRKITGLFDRIVSIEMIEAVGDRYYEDFYKTCSTLLTTNGLLVIQMILSPDSRYDLIKTNVDFIQKYIFPGSLIPSLHRLNTATKTVSDLNLYTLEDIGNHYVKTLSDWRDNFNKSINEVRQLGFDDRFIRMWNYYLSYCMAAFATKNITCVQAVYARPNNLNLSDYFSKI